MGIGQKFCLYNCNYIGNYINIQPRTIEKDFYDKLKAYYKNLNASKKIRLGGLTRVDTALSIANAHGGNEIDNVVIATAYNYPDSLTGSVLAKKLNAPILLSSPLEDEKNINYIKTHLKKSGKITLLGGPLIVSETIVTRLKNLGYTNFERLGGLNRYDTNNLINNKLNVSKGTSIIIATGKNFPDTLSISNIAGIKGYPIVLVDDKGLTEETLAYIIDMKLQIQ